MSNFDDNIVDNIVLFEKYIQDARSKQRGLDWGHECDCEYCDEDQGIPQETEDENDKLNREIKDYKRTISSLRGYASLKGIELAALTDKGK